MASAFVDDMKETYLGRVEEISPNIRYCAYNIGDETAINDLMQMRLKGTAGGDVFTSSLDVGSLLHFILPSINQQKGLPKI